MVDRSDVEAHINEIETEMRKIGMWSDKQPPPEAFEFTRAFAMDTMAFSQWLQFIFIPRVREILQSGADFPVQSQVGAQAIREFDGQYEADHLVTLLSAFDRVIEAG
jgi:uncharacterized protein YqcC (DUF446 family)